MIQVCSQCGTRWNVRDRRRTWCPRCNGSLMPPSAPAPTSDAQWSARPPGPAGGGPGIGSRPQLPPGYRWVAVRPGAPPHPRRPRRVLGPTPRYATIPRWGLVDQIAPADQQQEVARGGPSSGVLRGTLWLTMAVLGAAALIHLARYALLIINRTVLLPPWLAAIATWFGVVLSVVAAFMVVASLIMLTNWLISRRAAAYAFRGATDPRPSWRLQAGCLLPFVNLFWAPVFVIELAAVEERLGHLRRPIVVWWLAWIASYAVSIWSIATSFTRDAQGIADNTMTTMIAYLLALATLLLAEKVVSGFERRPVERPSKRWVIVPDDGSRPEDQPEPEVPVESRGQDPAA
ncbi:DUF4328 domain-containing protein [Mycobacterium sp. 1164985.4]|uniref:DUF4328 domain-containing protein n=1 Tax=Mycobacterium sp. 1164985.4 TaxID=1834069 RepID=UPI0007FF6ABF|nr:DUF4328 domain-containing protein [Mycobacterium sp. 1164985.4]OBK76326.1 hypothetical protein A5650_15485 [Mycobacterium sp. 1164985.4]